MNDETPPDLVEVQLLGVPVQLQQRASEHNDGLRREFQLLVEQGHVDPSSVPARLVLLAADLDRRFQRFTNEVRAEFNDAARRGKSVVDAKLKLPREVGAAAQQFKALLAEADAYCAAGEHLLTLAASGDVVAFRNWVLDELTRQIDGQEPAPWPGDGRRTGASYRLEALNTLAAGAGCC